VTTQASPAGMIACVAGAIRRCWRIFWLKARFFIRPWSTPPQAGKAVVMAYLVAAAKVLGNDAFRYVRELVDGNDAMLEFVTEIDGIAINGVDIIRFDPTGRIAEFKVMVRPLKAVNKVWEVMAAQLAAARG